MARYRDIFGADIIAVDLKLPAADSPTPLDSALSYVVFVHAELRRHSAAGSSVAVLCEWERKLEDARHEARRLEKLLAKR